MTVYDDFRERTGRDPNKTIIYPDGTEKPWPTGILQMEGHPPVDAALWSKFVRNHESTTQEEYESLPDMFKRAADGIRGVRSSSRQVRRQEAVYRAALDNANCNPRPINEQRMREICDMASKPGFLSSAIPYDEYCQILFYDPHYKRLNEALEAGVIAELGSP